MKFSESIKNIVEKAKQKKVVLLLSLVYSFVWAVCKIVFGIFTFSWFFCISGASTLLFGFIKKIYFNNHKIDSFENKKSKSITIGILLIISGALFTFYMARLFFVPYTKEYGKILSITIATFSFAELGIAIYNFARAKKTNDILLQSFKSCSLASSCYAIVLTQVALLFACKTNGNFYNAISGVVFGSFAVLIGVYVLTMASKAKSENFENEKQR